MLGLPAAGMGYLGIFVVSILGNLIPFVPIPYLAAVYLFTLKHPWANPLLVGAVSGLGGALGKMLVYFMGRGARALLSESSAQRYERLGKLLRNYGALAAFVISATPSPDDVIVLPLGLMKYDAAKVFLGLLAGKIFISTLTAYTGCLVAAITGYELIVETAASVALFAVVILLLVYVNWEGILEELGERGVKGLLTRARREGAAFLLRRRGQQPPRR